MGRERQTWEEAEIKESVNEEEIRQGRASTGELEEDSRRGIKVQKKKKKKMKKNNSDNNNDNKTGAGEGRRRSRRERKGKGKKSI